MTAPTTTPQRIEVFGEDVVGGIHLRAWGSTVEEVERLLADKREKATRVRRMLADAEVFVGYAEALAEDAGLRTGEPFGGNDLLQEIQHMRRRLQRLTSEAMS